jgi:glutathione synthase/RimK-type ligase-like ATP-grasp enzyme
MSRPQNIQAASWKSGQFARAAQLGFDIPRMLISTDAAQARAFYEECRERVVYKVISDSGVVAPHQHALGMSAVLINAEQLEILDTVVVAPCLFQELLPKRADIRVTVIGEDVFAAELDSQAHEATRIDWRNAPLEIAYRKADLPVSIAERCLTFVRSYGLNFCALDLALTQDGRYLFLEAHPSGQFMWIEHKVPDLQMTDALVGCLIRGANR